MKQNHQLTYLSILSLILLQTQIFAAPPELILKASQNKGVVGDEITFKWKIKANNNRVRHPRVRFDGRGIKAKNKYKWTATSGTHVLYLEMGWKEGLKEKPLSLAEQKKKARMKRLKRKYIPPRKPHITAVQVVEIKSNKIANFIHPGLYNSQVELAEIYRQVHLSGSNPIKDALLAVLNAKASSAANKNIPYASLNWKPDPVKIVWAKSKDKMRMFDDGRAVYTHALLWAATGNKLHADKAIEILNAWSAIFEDVKTKNGDIYNSLLSSWSANHWVAGAEIIRHYKHCGKLAGWKDVEIRRFEKMCCVFKRLMLQWEGGANVNGLQNQRLAVARTCLTLGIFMNDQDLFDFGIYQIFEQIDSRKKTVKKHGHPVNLIELTIADDGEIMEFNRDGGHGRGSLNVITTIAEVLRHQKMPKKYRLYDLKLGKDKIPRLLMGSEYAADAYLNGPVKLSFGRNFKNTADCEHSEMIVNYYSNISKTKYPMPLTKKVNQADRPKTTKTYIIPWTTLSHAFTAPIKNNKN